MLTNVLRCLNANIARHTDSPSTDVFSKAHPHTILTRTHITAWLVYYRPQFTLSGEQVFTGICLAILDGSITKTASPTLQAEKQTSRKPFFMYVSVF